MQPRKMLVVMSLTCLPAALPACAEGPAPPAPERRSVAGFTTPESVLHDEARDVYLVSNIDGAPLDRDDRAFISRVSPDGEVLDPRWIDGASEGVTLNAPKGMAIVEDRLYVADIDAIRVFDASDGAPIQEIAVPGATLLNDVAALPDGSIAVSDSGMTLEEGAFVSSGSAGLVVIDPTGQVEKPVSDPTLPFPNGLVHAGDALWMVYFGAARVESYDASWTRRREIALPAGQLDGIVRLDEGRLLVSSWETNAVHLVDVRGGEEAPPRVATLAEDLPSPADIGWDRARNRLLVPLFTEGEIVLLDVE